jgi:monofunctional biosynthetic peptidoglycan transglycosylase
MRSLCRLILWCVAVFFGLTATAVLALRWCAPISSAFMLEAQVAARVSGDNNYSTHYEWTPYSAISSHMKLAVIASEDQKFAFHPGFDFDAIDSAIKERERGKKLRGASTISQQVAKNLFLWPGQNLTRKALEAYFTVLIELLWPKQRILEMYLNIAEFGNGIYGVGAAAPRFFHTDALHLSQRDAALLTTVLPSPKHLHADRPGPYMYRRADWIIQQMNALGGKSYILEVERASQR